jgi:SAM-dependent methyltransferase
MKKHPIEVFSDWVTSGKDDGMEKNHLESVTKMLDFSLKNFKNFSFIDAGCGTGWVVRMVSKMNLCVNACGIDGSRKMIEKAKRLDINNQYFCSNLLTWKPKFKKDLVHSMEVLYYFENPSIVLKNFFDNWLTERGRLIIGIDFYKENLSCHDWPDKTNVSIMKLLTITDWIRMFEGCGFKNIKSWRVGQKKNWGGTLIVYGTKI